MSHRPPASIHLGLVASVLVLSLSASAAPKKIPSPLGEQPVVVVGTLMADRGANSKTQGFSACYGMFGNVAKKPTLEFELSGPLPKDAEVRLIKRSGVFITPNGTYYCVKEGMRLTGEALEQVGRYAFRSSQASYQERGHPPKIMFASPKAIRAGALKRLRPASLDFAHNPAEVTLTVAEGPALATKHVGLEKCAHEKWVVPVATFDIAETSTFVVRHDGAGIIETPDGSCLKNSRGTFSKVELKRGTYRVWRNGQTPEKIERAAMRLVLRDTERPLAWPGAKTYDYTKNRKRHVDIPFQYSKPAINVIRHSCAGIGQKPIALVRVGLGGIRLGQTWGPNAPRILVGPLEASGSRQFDCTNGFRKNMAGGTYAVFQKTSAELVGAKAVYSLGPPPKDLLEQTAAVTPDLSLQEREVGRFYAHYFNQESFIYDGLSQYPQKNSLPVDALFANAPKGIRLFARSTKGGLRVGEPLLLKHHGLDKSDVYRLDGSTLTVRNSALSTKVPAAIEVAVSPAPIQAPKDIKEGLGLAGPMQIQSIQKLNAAYEKYRSCYARYRSKRDPTFGENFDLVNLRTGQKVSDKWHRRAEKKCKWKRHLKKERSTVKAIVRARNQEMKAALKAVNALKP